MLRSLGGDGTAFGNAMQMVDAERFRGKSVTLKGRIRVEPNASSDRNNP